MTPADRGARGLGVEVARGAARRGGLRAGDCIVALNGRRPVDVLDLETAAADGVLWLRVLRDGQPLDLAVRPTARGGHGIGLVHGLGVPPRVCRNACRFCFVDQVPEGLRPSLSFKDDDYRLSFLHGTFITLTNLSAADVARIVRLRLSPLYVSLHAWDDDARAALMGARARGSRELLQRLAAAGLEIHVQVVLCPGWNDGAVLEETVGELSRLAAVEDVGIVPVSLAAEGDLRRVTPDDAAAVVAAVEAWQAGFAVSLGRAFVDAADEFHLLTGSLPPASDAALQFENGIGMSAHLLAEARGLAESRAFADHPSAPVRLLGGTLVGPVLDEVCARLARGGAQCRPFLVTNRLFGGHVTVSGLLGGREVLAALQAEPLLAGEWLAAPRCFLPRDLGRTLDDVTEAELAAACGGRLVVADGLSDAFARLGS